MGTIIKDYLKSLIALAAAAVVTAAVMSIVIAILKLDFVALLNRFN
jgi:hypothetical protein